VSVNTAASYETFLSAYARSDLASTAKRLKERPLQKRTVAPRSVPATEVAVVESGPVVVPVPTYDPLPVRFRYRDHWRDRPNHDKSAGAGRHDKQAGSGRHDRQGKLTKASRSGKIARTGMRNVKMKQQRVTMKRNFTASRRFTMPNRGRMGGGGMSFGSRPSFGGRMGMGMGGMGRMGGMGGGFGRR
jgi:hypothetical protein